jgi:aspartate racemase
MAKHIGIVACSAEGAALCYRTICLEGAASMGRHNHPEISMHTHSLQKYMECIYRDDWRAVGELMLDSGRKLAKIGADFLICPDNTIHQGLDLVREHSPLPWLHIAEEVAAEASRRRFKNVGVTGTKYLMEGPVYRPKLEEMGIAVTIPELAPRVKINSIIFDELVNGRFLPDSLKYFQETISELKKRGCDAVALSCTEIPLLVSDATSPLPTLDSTRLLARAALKRAVETPESA